MMMVGQPKRSTTAPFDLHDGGGSATGILLGATLIAGSAAATAQLVDAGGTVLCDLSAPANGSHVHPIPTVFAGKVRLAAITGTGAIVNAWVR